MKLSEFLDRIKLQNPNIGQQNISDNILTTLLNQAVDQVNILTGVYATYSDFDITADKWRYNISDYISNYLGTDKRGLFFKNSDDEWKEVYAKTEAWIRSRFPDYLNMSSVDIPNYYWVENDEIGFYPKPSTTKSSGARLFHLKKSSGMSSNDDYPFTGNSTEITAFIPLDDAILAYVRWKLSPQFGTVSDTDLRWREFITEVSKGKKNVASRRDLANDARYRMRI